MEVEEDIRRLNGNGKNTINKLLKIEIKCKSKNELRARTHRGSFAALFTVALFIITQGGNDLSGPH